LIHHDHAIRRRVQGEAQRIVPVSSPCRH
jgi:hypothetical protein